MWELVYAYSGIDFSLYRQTILRRRVASWMQRQGLATPQALYAFLDAHHAAVPELIDYVTVDVSDFFRNRVVFDYLLRDILPNIAITHEIRFQCWGCGRGQECYSLAMMMTDASLGVHWQVLGMDIDMANLRDAQRGVYRVGELRQLRAEERRAHWEPAGDDRFRIRPALRERVHWVRGSVFAAPFQTASADVVLCRNLLIFIEPEHHARVFQELARVLRPGGVLVIGGVERVPGTWRDFFAPLSIVHHVYQRREEMHG